MTHAVEDSITTSFTYNANDAVETITTNDGVVATLAYDVVDRPTGISYSNGAGDVQMAYTDLDQLASITDGSTGTTTFSYEPRFHGLSMVAYPSGQKVKYEYNGFGEPIASRVDGHQGDSYSYDEEGRLLRIFAGHGTTTFFYNPSTGQLVKVQLGNGVTEEYTYLPVTGELATLTQRQVNGDLIAEFSYTYYLNGLKKTVTEVSPEGGTKTISYVYDDLLRLASATYDLESGQQRVESYEYDANGNRLRRLVTLDGNTEEDTRSVEKFIPYVTDDGRVA